MPSDALNLAALRQRYQRGSLDAADAAPEPAEQFGRWFQQAREAALPEPNAMCLSTVSAEGRPAGRIVLLKEYTAEGFVWFTNYESRKGQDLHAHPAAALTFFWAELERQVRIEGRVERISHQESDAYFRIRPRESQIGAWASPQSRPIGSRHELELREQEAIQRFGNKEVERPPHWGGYRLRPAYFEFWQGRPSRLHDRLIYTLTPAGLWQLSRLAP